MGVLELSAVVDGLRTLFRAATRVVRRRAEANDFTPGARAPTRVGAEWRRFDRDFCGSSADARRSSPCSRGRP